jgi:hypothetical protein
MFIQPDPAMLDAWLKKGSCVSRKMILKSHKRKRTRLAIRKQRLALKKQQNGISQKATTGN